MRNLYFALIILMAIVGCGKEDEGVNALHHYKIDVVTSKITYLKYETNLEEFIVIDSNNYYAYLRSYHKELDGEFLELTINDWGTGDIRAHLTIYKDGVLVVNEDQGVNEPRIYKL